MQPSHLVRAARRAAGLSQRKLAEQAGVGRRTVERIESGQQCATAELLDRLLAVTGHELGLLPRVDPTAAEQLEQHLRLSLTQRLRLGLGESPRLRVRPTSPAWQELVMLTRLGTVVLDRRLALSLWIPLGTVATLSVVLHNARRTPPPCAAVRVRMSQEAVGDALVPVTLQDGRRVWAPTPAELALPDLETTLLRQADVLLHSQAARDVAGRRRPAHRDPDEWQEDWRLMVTKSVRPESRPDVTDGRAWRIGAAASLAQRMQPR